MTKSEVQKQIDEAKKMTLKEAVRFLAETKDAHAEVKAQAARYWEIHEYLSKQLIPARMEEMGIRTANLNGIGTISLREELSCSTPPENRGEFWDWLRANGYQDLIKDSVNSSTLKAQVKKWLEDGEEFPMDLLKVNFYQNAVLVGRPK